MTALSRHLDLSFANADWQPDAVQILDEQHLIAISDSPRRRVEFGAALGQFLMGLPDADVCTLHGRHITDLESFCSQLERTIPGPPMRRRIEGTGGLTSLLRSRPHTRGRRAPKFRFYLWHDADVLLSRNEELFGRLVDAISGVAAEAEYVDDDRLLIHRAIYLGSSLLARYASKDTGQFQSWTTDTHSDEGFWQVITGLERPPFTQHQIDDL